MPELQALASELSSKTGSGGWTPSCSPKGDKPNIAFAVCHAEGHAGVSRKRKAPEEEDLVPPEEATTEVKDAPKEDAPDEEDPSGKKDPAEKEGAVEKEAATHEAIGAARNVRTFGAGENLETMEQQADETARSLLFVDHNLGMGMIALAVVQYLIWQI